MIQSLINAHWYMKEGKREEVRAAMMDLEMDIERLEKARDAIEEWLDRTEIKEEE